MPDGAVPELIVGSGANGWLDLAADRATEVPIGVGSQGGYHVWTRFRYRYVTGDVGVRYRVLALTGEVLSDSGFVTVVDHRGYVRWGDGWESNSAYTAVLGMFVPINNFVGNTYTLEATLRPSSGADLVVQRRVTMQSP